MEIKATPWHETRTLISPRVEMLSNDGIIEFKTSYLKTESPKTATSQKRFIHYNADYVKYCFLKEFYQAIFSSAKQKEFQDKDKELIALLTEAVTEFTQYCEEQSLEENALELFRTFCKVHLFT